MPTTPVLSSGRSRRTERMSAKPYLRTHRTSAAEAASPVTPATPSGLFGTIKSLVSTPLRWMTDGDSPSHRRLDSASDGTPPDSPGTSPVQSREVPFFPNAGTARTPNTRVLGTGLATLPRQRAWGRDPRYALKVNSRLSLAAAASPKHRVSSLTSIPLDLAGRNGVSLPLAAPVPRDTNPAVSLPSPSAVGEDPADPTAVESEEEPPLERKRERSGRDKASRVRFAGRGSPEQMAKRRRTLATDFVPDAESQSTSTLSPFAHNRRMVPLHKIRSQIYRYPYSPQGNATHSTPASAGAATPATGPLDRLPHLTRLSTGRAGANQSPFNAARILEALDAAPGIPFVPSRSRQAAPRRGERALNANVGQDSVRSRLSDSEDMVPEEGEDNDYRNTAPASQPRSSRGSRAEEGRRRTGRKGSVSVAAGQPYGTRPRKPSVQTTTSEGRVVSAALSEVPEERSGGRRNSASIRRPSASHRAVTAGPGASSAASVGIDAPFAAGPASSRKARGYTTRVHAKAPAVVRWKFSACLDLSDDDDELEQLRNVPPVPILGLSVTQPAETPLAEAATRQAPASFKTASTSAPEAPSSFATSKPAISFDGAPITGPNPDSKKTAVPSPERSAPATDGAHPFGANFLRGRGGSVSTKTFSGFGKPPTDRPFEVNQSGSSFSQPAKSSAPAFGAAPSFSAASSFGAGTTLSPVKSAKETSTAIGSTTTATPTFGGFKVPTGFGSTAPTLVSSAFATTADAKSQPLSFSGFGQASTAAAVIPPTMTSAAPTTTPAITFKPLTVTPVTPEAEPKSDKPISDAVSGAEPAKATVDRFTAPTTSTAVPTFGSNATPSAFGNTASSGGGFGGFGSSATVGFGLATPPAFTAEPKAEAPSAVAKEAATAQTGTADGPLEFGTDSAGSLPKSPAFGLPANSTSAAAPSPSIFGASTAAAASDKTAAPVFSFNGTANSSATTPATMQTSSATPTFAFGGVAAAPAVPVTTATTIATPVKFSGFGTPAATTSGSSTQENEMSTDSMLESPASAPVAPVLNSSSNPPPVVAPASAFSFGNAAKPATPAFSAVGSGSSSFTFGNGASGTAATTPNAFSSGFNFGGAKPATTSEFGSGAATPTAEKPPAFGTGTTPSVFGGFGSGASTPAFGSGTASPAGAAAPNTNFSFNASSSAIAPSTGGMFGSAAKPATPFAFGAATPSVPSAGRGTNPGSTTPSAFSGGFNVGAGGATPTFNFGASNPPSAQGTPLGSPSLQFSSGTMGAPPGANSASATNLAGRKIARPRRTRR
ncbi:hypothetical protein IWQ60_006495 [Tieghemiomyces parasiticus]|uniref:Uncharacterized protein n=1 Tax=Tieghemiomyces parasiticus TaxID=78921 RepID=A0A9W8A9S3_9FUNG|nr:hypothetical protein IWQ60_006495 [Tieghemiomyces parasiticus]